MIELYGFPISNFYNKVKLALLEKDIPFTEKRMAPTSTDSGYLEKVPTGKIPWMVHNDYIIYESTVMMEYLEDAFPDAPALMPKEPVKRARTRIIMSIIDLYIDPPARCMYDLLRGKPVDAKICEQATEKMEFGIQALGSATNFTPFIADDHFTMADCSALATLTLVDDLYKELKQENKLESLKGYSNYMENLKGRASSKKVLRSIKAASRGLAMQGRGN